MKQQITPEQIRELSETGKEKLIEWEKNHTGSWHYSRINNILVPRPNIGQMIEFLDENNKRFNFHLNIYHREKSIGKGFWKILINEEEFYGVEMELCDTLWLATKEELEK